MLDTLKKLDNKVIQFVNKYREECHLSNIDGFEVLNYLARLDDPEYSWLRWYSSNIEDMVERNNLWAIHGDWIDKVIDRVFEEYPEQRKQLKENTKLIGYFMGKISKISHGRIEGQEVIEKIKLKI